MKMVCQTNVKIAIVCVVLMSMLGATGVVSAAAAGASATFWHGKVVWVPDGDTIYVQRLLTRKGQVKLLPKRIGIHLAGIDAPEPKMPFGAKATALMRKLVLGKVVRIKTVAKDRYGRLIAVVMSKSSDVSHVLLRAGLAWHYKRYSKSKVMASLETAAKAGKRGLWRKPNPTPPWLWRRSQRAKRPKARPKSAATSKGTFHGNARSKVFHAPGCRYYSCKNCTKVLASEAKARALGYRPHKRCLARYKRRKKGS